MRFGFSTTQDAQPCCGKCCNHLHFAQALRIYGVLMLTLLWPVSASRVAGVNNLRRGSITAAMLPYGLAVYCVVRPTYADRSFEADKAHEIGALCDATSSGIPKSHTT